MAAEFDRWSAEKAAYAEKLRDKYPDFADMLDAQAAEDAVLFRMAKAAGMPESFLTVEPAKAPATPTQEATQAQSAALVSARSPLHEQLYQELKTRGQEVALPEPPKGLLEVQAILTGEGFDVEPIVYVSKGEVTYALLDRSERPNWDDVDYPTDAYSPIVQRGRRDGIIKITNWTRGVRDTSRFGISWDEVHNFVVPAVVDLSSQLARQVETSGVVFRVPTKAEFQAAGLRYPHLGKKRSWEHLYGDLGHGLRLVGGYSDSGGLGAVGGYPSEGHDDSVWFRLQAVFPSQKLPR